MPSYVSPKKGVEFIFYISLVSQSNTKVMQSNPTIASGDFKVSIDGGALANPATLPAVTPASSKMVKVTLSTSEMNGDNITFVASDASGAEWCDLVVNIQTSARQIDDLAYPAVSGRSTAIDASGQVTVGTIANNAITAAAIATDAIDADAIADNAINAAAIANDAITAAKIADGAIDAATFATGAITAAAIAADAIGASELAADAVTELQSGLATAASIAALNNLSAAQVNAQVAAALATYDPPTRAELTSDANAILAAIGDIETGSGESAATIWTYADRHLTQSAAEVIAAVSGSDLTITRAATFSATLTGLSIPATWTKVYFTFKQDKREVDSQSIVQIVESNPGAGSDGLLYLNGATGTAAQGSLTVNQGAGTIAIAIADDATAALPQAGGHYDLKVLLSDGSSQVLTEATASVALIATETV